MTAVSLRLAAAFLFFAASSVAVSAAGETGKVPADLIVLGDYLLPMESAEGDLTVIRDGAVAVSRGEIVAVGTRTEIESAFTSDNVIPGDGRVLMPGLINGHTHSAMVMFRGVADDLDLMAWLTNYVFPLEGQFVDAEMVRAGMALACWEMIRGGTTAIADMYFYPDTAAEVVDSCGIRAILGAAMIDFPSPGFEGWDDSFAAGLAYVERWTDGDGAPTHRRISPGFAVHAPYTVTPEHYVEVLADAKRLNAPILTHILEDYAEVEQMKATYGTTSIHHLLPLGVLDHSMIAAHTVWPDDEEIRIMAEKGVGAIHNPTSNMKTAAGVARIPEMLAAGVKVGLGTDGAASNNDLDMWEEIRLAALLHKGAGRNGDESGIRDATLMPAGTVLRMATSMGAEAIGLGDVTGQLREGYRADMIQVSLDSPRLSPLYDVVSHLVYIADSQDVVTTIVEGRVLMQGAKVLSLDAARVKADAEALGAEIAAALAARK